MEANLLGHFKKLTEKQLRKIIKREYKIKNYRTTFSIFTPNANKFFAREETIIDRAKEIVEKYIDLNIMTRSIHDFIEKKISAQGINGDYSHLLYYNHLLKIAKGSLTLKEYKKLINDLNKDIKIAKKGKDEQYKYNFMHRADQMLDVLVKIYNYKKLNADLPINKNLEKRIFKI